jgi:hypothetical protein
MKRGRQQHRWSRERVALEVLHLIACAWVLWVLITGQGWPW